MVTMGITLGRIGSARMRLDSNKMKKSQEAPSIAGEIREEIGRLIFRGGHFVRTDEFAFRRLVRMCETLQAVEAPQAFVLKVEVFQLAGKIEDCEHWSRQAHRLHATWDAHNSLCLAYSNLGFATKAASLYAEITDVSHGQVNAIINLGVASGCFSQILEAANALERAGGEVERKDLVMLAANVRDTLSMLSVSEESLRLLMDEAGTLMRERSLLWLNDRPDVVVSRGGDPAFVALNYRLDVPALEAAEMTWELAERVAAKDWLPNSVTVSFIGEKNTSQRGHL